eukprot:TRINITY_DN2931_c0_g1_i1.p1 TRINITY_DN2931_c0_g1~~TRINITY_DN2931_c0_g1_i1.p1  ORF type:complete len:291 (-),score=66.24 TRINITY_DN2931_c0_g1_i1:44-916(-)
MTARLDSLLKTKHDTSNAKEPSLEYVKTIGTSSISRVDLVKKRESGETFALKTVNKKCKQFNVQRVESEIRAGSILKRHSGIITARSNWEDDEHVYLLMEHIVGIDLISLMETRSLAPLKEPLAKEIVRQLIDIVGFSHSRGVAHRDIKLDNIMVDQDGNVRLIDFGLCYITETKSTSSLCTDRVGSIAYVAPEVLRKMPYDGFAADIWSLGIVVFSLLFGSFPFSMEDRRDMVRDPTTEVQLEFPDVEVSKDARDLIRQLLEVDPVKRITLDDMRCHPWLDRKSKTTKP